MTMRTTPGVYLTRDDAGRMNLQVASDLATRLRASRFEVTRGVTGDVLTGDTAAIVELISDVRHAIDLEEAAAVEAALHRERQNTIDHRQWRAPSGAPYMRVMCRSAADAWLVCRVGGGTAIVVLDDALRIWGRAPAETEDELEAAWQARLREPASDRSGAAHG